MKRACAEIWEGIVALAEGQENLEARAHLATCSACSAKYQEMARVLGATRNSFHNAPESLIQSAIALMPARQRAIRASLIRSTLGVLGARSDAEDFQVVVGADNLQTRLLFTKEENGWEVVGKAPLAWEVSRDGLPLEMDEDGRFAFHASSLQDTGFSLTSPALAIEIPSAEELLNNGSGNAH